MHKIAFAGIPGSGRTSVFTEVKKLLAMKNRVEEVPDLKPGAPFDFDQRAGFTSTFYRLSSQVNEENIRSQGRPDFLLCDGSLLDHWLEWRLAQAEKPGNGQAMEKGALLQAIYRFWIPTYTVLFRLRVDSAVLRERWTMAGLKEFDAERIRRTEDFYGQAIAQENLPAFDVWNNHSVDESAQEAMARLADMKLI